LVTLNLSDFIETHGRIMQPRKFQNHGYSLSYRPVGGFLPEDVRQAGLRPFDSSRSFRESEQSTLHPQAEPSQKPFLVALTITGLQPIPIIGTMDLCFSSRVQNQSAHSWVPGRP